MKYGLTTAQEVLESLKDRWFQADNPPADQLLNEEEFLSFLHPEHSRGMLRYMVKEIVRDLGKRMNLKFIPKECQHPFLLVNKPYMFPKQIKMEMES